MTTTTAYAHQVEVVCRAAAAMKNEQPEYAKALLATLDDPLMAAVELVGQLLGRP